MPKVTKILININKDLSKQVSCMHTLEELAKLSNPQTDVQIRTFLSKFYELFWRCRQGKLALGRKTMECE